MALWEVTDRMLKWYQPYVTLANGQASAQESLLLDYVRISRQSPSLPSIDQLSYRSLFSALNRFERSE